MKTLPSAESPKKARVVPFLAKTIGMRMDNMAWIWLSHLREQPQNTLGGNIEVEFVSAYILPKKRKKTVSAPRPWVEREHARSVFQETCPAEVALWLPRTYPTPPISTLSMPLTIESADGLQISHPTKSPPHRAFSPKASPGVGLVSPTLTP